MKKTLFLILSLAAFAMGQTIQIQGQRGFSVSLVTWSAASGNWSNKSRHAILGGNVYVDTSATGQAAQMKRVDNTADSCSNPFNLGSDSSASSRAIWLYKLLGRFRSVDKDSGQHVYRVQVRERLWNSSLKQWYWSDWSVKGANSGYADVAVQDSILIANTGTTAKVSQYSLFFSDGAQARLCPDNTVATATAAADTVWSDSLFFFSR